MFKSRNVNELFLYRPYVRIWELVVGRFLWKYLPTGILACLKPQVKNYSKIDNYKNIPKSQTSKPERKAVKHAWNHKPDKLLFTNKYTRIYILVYPLKNNAYLILIKINMMSLFAKSDVGIYKKIFFDMAYNSAVGDTSQMNNPSLYLLHFITWLNNQINICFKIPFFLTHMPHCCLPDQLMKPTLWIYRLPLLFFKVIV